MRAITIDQGLAAAGVILALLSLAFAAFMVSQYDRRTSFEGTEVFRFLPRPSLHFNDFRSGAGQIVQKIRYRF